MKSDKEPEVLPPNRVTTPEEVPGWLRERYEKGYVPMDAPPGFEEMYYKAWKRVGGVVIPPKPVTADDL